MDWFCQSFYVKKLTISKRHTEFEIIKSIRKGNINNYRTLVNDYKDVSFSLAVSILKNETEAEDALQEAFIKAFRNLKHFKFNAAFSTWLYRIVVNTCLNYLKSKKHKSFQNEDDHLLNLESENESGYDNLLNDDRNKIIQNILKQLKPDEAMLLNLFYLSEFSIDEIKEITGFKESKIKVTLHRARKSFKELAEEKLVKTQLVF